MEGNVIRGTLSSGGSMVGGVGTVYGKDGKSAYEIALIRGFEGTEEEWLASLKGEPGEPGSAGYTPVKGTDYWTEEDKDEIKAYVNEINSADTDKIVCETGGSVITLKDSSNRELQGLRLFGRDGIGDDGQVHIVGEKGSVTVKVIGKNLADVRKFSSNDKIQTPTSNCSLSNNYGTTISATTGDSVTVTQTQYQVIDNTIHSVNGFMAVGFYCPLIVGETITLSYNYKATANPLDDSAMQFAINGQNTTKIYAADEEPSLYYSTFKVTSAMIKDDHWNWLEMRLGGKSGVLSNIQVEYGNKYTGYEPYTEQTITVSTPGGLPGGDVCDEIDFAKGVLIRRCAEQSETPLPEDVLEAYGKMHTYKPNTTITNDYGAEMAVEYVADTKNFICNEIDKKFTELQNAILASGANV